MLTIEQRKTLIELYAICYGTSGKDWRKDPIHDGIFTDEEMRFIDEYERTLLSGGSKKFYLTEKEIIEKSPGVMTYDPEKDKDVQAYHKKIAFMLGEIVGKIKIVDK